MMDCHAERGRLASADADWLLRMHIEEGMRMGNASGRAKHCTLMRQGG